jgi:hypothetical protein
MSSSYRICKVRILLLRFLWPFANCRICSLGLVSSKQFQQLLFGFVIVAGILGTLAIVGLIYKGWIAPWTGRFYSLWNAGLILCFKEQRDEHVFVII